MQHAVQSKRSAARGRACPCQARGAQDSDARRASKRCKSMLRAAVGHRGDVPRTSLSGAAFRYYSLFPRELKVLRKKVVNSILHPAPFSNTSANALLIALDPFL